MAVGTLAVCECERVCDACYCFLLLATNFETNISSDFFAVCFCVVYLCLCLCLCFVLVFVLVFVFVLVLCVCMCVCA